MEKDNIDKIVQLGHELGTIRKSNHNHNKPITSTVFYAQIASPFLTYISMGQSVPVGTAGDSTPEEATGGTGTNIYLHVLKPR